MSSVGLRNKWAKNFNVTFGNKQWYAVFILRDNHSRDYL